MTIVSIIPVNKIKYSRDVKEHIFQRNIWIKNDKYNAKIESSPGFFIRIHPKLLHREDFGKQLTDVLLSLTPDVEDETVVGWYNQHDIPVPTSGEPVTIPLFHLETSVRKWGGIKCEVLRVTSSQEDSEFLKYLLSLAGEKQLIPKGKFIPEGLVLMEGKNIVHTILSEQQAYIDATVGIPITGVSITAMTEKNSSDTSVKAMIETFPTVHSVERTRDSETYGRWLVVANETDKIAVLNHLNKNLAKLYAAQTGQRTIITAGSKEILTGKQDKTVVRTYAEILSQQYSQKPQSSVNSTHKHP